jgi:hypothetical protein
MKITRCEYDKRKNEIIKYMNAVKLLDAGTCSIQCVDILGQSSSMQIDDELSKILKANSFILLYNLIESTIVNSIKAVSNSIQNDELTYEQLSESIKRLWIKQEARKIREKNQSIELVQRIAETILNWEFLSLQVDSVSISGNIDTQEIRKITQQIGWEQSKDGRELVTIKNKRNNLAHGEYTFSDIGKEYSIKDLEELKNKTLLYLDDVLSKVETYIAEERYKLKR